jgi:hypothetical protein
MVGVFLYSSLLAIGLVSFIRLVPEGLVTAVESAVEVYDCSGLLGWLWVEVVQLVVVARWRGSAQTPGLKVVLRYCWMLDNCISCGSQGLYMMQFCW